MENCILCNSINTHNFHYDNKTIKLCNVCNRIVVSNSKIYTNEILDNLQHHERCKWIINGTSPTPCRLPGPYCHHHENKFQQLFAEHNDILYDELYCSNIITQTVYELYDKIKSIWLFMK